MVECDVVFELEIEDVTLEDELAEMEVVAKLMEVLCDATAHSWFASDSAGAMLFGQFAARQVVRLCAKLVELPSAHWVSSSQVWTI